MKRPHTIAVFAPVMTSTKDIAAKVWTVLHDEMKGRLGSYYARILYNPEKRYYYFGDETLDLADQLELFRWIDRDGSSMWRMMLNLGFAPAETFAAVFANVQKPSETTLLLRIDPEITRWIETDETTRLPFVLFLIRIARSIGATWFISGPHIYEWRPLDISQSLDYVELGIPYVVSWKAGLPEEANLVAGFHIPKEKTFMTTLNYKFGDLFPSIPK